ncbi:CoA-binding protein [Lactonifactor sp. BIOML-A3]|uniref:acetate--CoA ligase family protein n=1 Tax=Lactonifactor TaxID=420345 RepID=UPI0012B0C97A|nr:MULTISPECIES: acetate--CoA ligase family protein [Lactonifactor]MCB5712987.1 acetate--CoA ligase family protein [Lactonifactor longoviformis]MCB5717203.1 acetate--CoA ligase family protein [Lactonifactor longoviformis]MSA03511.1 CoA-binding protein [Lactonifactor sp. BIOML-A5]MSA09833.1 CoA-binding protein [Lactonifactor sp. BIOML-A4]MSA14463.1 CoA-binding protein [Lactonifactor sp. BIOML-A3]
MNLKSLLRPGSVAVIGASEKLGFGRDASENLMKGDLGDQIYLVNPKREEILGRKCYKSIAEIGKPVELAVICTPMSTVNGLLREAAACGTKAAVVYASGYSEAGEEGKAAQKELAEVAKACDLAVCGPNCGGFINNRDGVFAFGLLMPERRKAGNIGLVSQSGQVCSLLASVPYLNFSYAISSGNNAVAGVEDYLEFLVEDDATKVIAVYLEGVRQPERFVRILGDAARKRKPIIALKVGASEKARQTTTAHTGSLAGSDGTFNALFKKYGVIRVDDMEDLVNTCLVFSTLEKPLKNKNLAIMNVSGGEAAISADVSQLQGASLANLSEDTLRQIKEMLPGYATPNNPLDMTATLVFEINKYKSAVKLMMEDENVGVIAMGHNPPEKIPERDREVDFGFAAALAEINRETEKPIVILPGMSRKRDPELREFYGEHHIPILDSPKYGLSALRRYGEFCMYSPDDRTLIPAVPPQNRDTKSCILSEHESKLLLKDSGIPVPDEIVVTAAGEIPRAAEKLGYPLVMKIDSPDIPHKTDMGGVKLGITDEKEAIAAFEEIMTNARIHKPQARIRGVLMQQMLPKGTEMILGINRDPQFGPMVLAGLGGIYTEVFQDAALYPAPLNRKEAMEMIQSLKSYAILKGYRGSRPLDTEALADMIVKLGDLAVEHCGDLKELDMNPVFLYEKGVYAADALIVKG